METTEKRHYAVIDSYHRKLTLKFKGQVLAETTSALILKEVGKTVYNPVFYIPKEDIKLDLMEDSGRSTHCPIKGDASYWFVKDESTEEYFGWSYENPLPRSKKIAGYLSFNLNYVTLISEPI